MNIIYIECNISDILIKEFNEQFGSINHKNIKEI